MMRSRHEFFAAAHPMLMRLGLATIFMAAAGACGEEPRDRTMLGAQEVFSGNCALSGCHVRGGAGPMSLEKGRARGSLVNVPAVSLCTGYRVVAGMLDQSCVYQVLLADDMPFERAPLPREKKEIIYAWIAAGAPE